jgi:hypothetical protein
VDTILLHVALWPAGVTVWELGEVYRGPFTSNYWSSKGLYRHAYPVSTGFCHNTGLLSVLLPAFDPA